MEKSRFSQFDRLVSSASKSLQHLKEFYMDKYRLSAAHTACLCRLLENEEGLTQADMARTENIDRAQVSRVVKFLLSQGYIIDSGEGSYKRIYHLTEAGRKVAIEIQPIILNINRFVSDEISDEDIEAFYRTFRKITDNLSKAVELSVDGEHGLFRKDS